MKLDLFAVAEAAVAVEGKLYIHGAGVTRIDAPILPWTHPQIAIVVRLVVEGSKDYEIEHELALTVCAPDDEPLIPRWAAPVTVHESLLAAEGEQRAINFALTLSPLTFFRSGIHRVDFELNGTMVRQFELPVVVMSEAVDQN